MRVLLDFFYKEPDDGRDDCWVDHFRSLEGFESKFPREIRVPPGWLKEIRTNLNKRLAHFTEVRWLKQGEAPSMNDYSLYWDEIETLIGKFGDALPAEERMIFIDRTHVFENRDNVLWT